MSPARHLIHLASHTVYIPSVTDLSVPRGIQNWKFHEFPGQPVTVLHLYSQKVFWCLSWNFLFFTLSPSLLVSITDVEDRPLPSASQQPFTYLKIIVLHNLLYRLDKSRCFHLFLKITFSTSLLDSLVGSSLSVMLQAVLQHAECSKVHEEPLSVPLLAHNLLVDPLADLASLSCCCVFSHLKTHAGKVW